MRIDESTRVFFALLKAGLWETEVSFLPYGELDFAKLHQLAEEQGVVGLIAAGLGHVKDRIVPKEEALQFIGQTLQMELQNQAMNNFIREIFEKMGDAGIHFVLVKGQGIAQCYERPLWRSCGDIDLLLDKENYEKAKVLLIPLASSACEEDVAAMHLGLNIDSWVVELHGLLHSTISQRADYFN